ncbi:hypothetical protein M1L60_23325 [Actinoplanes sp. TRM 88003]|uniref:Uncharacterized protein n=1 Tax=Paractinoplanes aksuensis TaxID=2939490 RepID=A0ABT1DU14_9ACTN|nr:hypothetical protein [Actinoplanes aksuensis]MCO8273531.1 hypothetical protein [Actinoplanes aksuensis]
MEQYLNTAYDVTNGLFGPESGIPWWAWMAVVGAMFWKVAVKEPKTATDRDNEMLGEMFGDGKKKK